MNADVSPGSADGVCQVMAIINVTPDSFSGDGLLADGLRGSNRVIDRAVTRAVAAAEQGASVVDIGGFSTRPGSVEVSEADELERVIPIVRAVASAAQCTISIDTFRAAVAASAIDAGATLVNSIWGLDTPTGELNRELGIICAQNNAKLVLTHNRRAETSTNDIGGHVVGVEYDDVVADVLDVWIRQANLAVELGVSPVQLMVDPGLGFGKTPPQNEMLLGHLSQLCRQSLPVLIGVSRKSVLAHMLGRLRADDPDRRDQATTAISAVAALAGAAMVRVHTVPENVVACAIGSRLRHIGPRSHTANELR